eukprot:8901445-Ditylum_brightwellii.AAC.1
MAVFLDRKTKTKDKAMYRPIMILKPVVIGMCVLLMESSRDSQTAKEGRYQIIVSGEPDG